jgi:VWFA-related protein
LRRRLIVTFLAALLGAGVAPGKPAADDAGVLLDTGVLLDSGAPVEAAPVEAAPVEAPPAADEDAGEEEPPPKGPIFSGETDAVLVEVPVEVHSGGLPLAGLTAADFELYDNGRRQEVLGVEAIDRGLGRFDKGLPVVARRHFLLLFDLSFTSPAALARAREAALETVERQLDPSDLVGVATFRLQEGVRLLLGFSPDRSQVRVTLDALERRPDLDLRPDPLQIYLGRPAGTQSALRPDAPALREEVYAHLQHLIDRESAARTRRDVAVLSDSLASLARLLRGAAGRKHLLFFSEGFDSRLLLGGSDADREALGQAIQQGDLARVDSDAVFGSRAALDLLNRLTEELRRADCSLHTVDISPLGQSKGKDGLFMLARDTGAVFFENFNHLGQAFSQLLDRTRLTYVVTYRPADLAGDGSYRKLKVKLAGPAGTGSDKYGKNVKLSYRPGYYDDDIASFAQEERRLLLADRLLDRRAGPIKAKVFALPTGELVRGKRFVPVVVEVAGASFLGEKQAAGAQAGPERSQKVMLDAQVFVYAMNEEGGIADFFSQAIPFDLARHGRSLERRGFKLFAPLLLPTGRYTLRALVRNGSRGHFGVASRNLQVAKKAPALRVPPALVDPEWLLVRAERKDLAGEGAGPDPLELLRQATVKPEPAAPEPAAPEAAPPEPARRQAHPSATPVRTADGGAGSAAAYLKVLALFTERPWHEALDGLEAYELEAVGSDPENKAARLGRNELAAAKALVQSSPDALWPLLSAHHDLFFRHRKSHRAYLELQSRQLVRSLADLAESGSDDAVRLAAAQALASIGSTLLYEGRAAGFELLERSLQLDPANEPAHLGLAAYYEKFGGPYERAVEWLDQLVLRRPDSREGRLRLAINLLRLAGPAAASWPHAEEDARDHFERLVADPHDDWISSIAAQELARFQRGEPAAAAALLEEALARRPEDAEIQIQLTYLYDRLGRAEKSKALAEKLGAAGAEPSRAKGPSPRGRYNQWSSETLAEGRRDLHDGAASRIAALRPAPVPAAADAAAAGGSSR